MVAEERDSLVPRGSRPRAERFTSTGGARTAGFVNRCFPGHGPGDPKGEPTVERARVRGEGPSSARAFAKNRRKAAPAR